MKIVLKMAELELTAIEENYLKETSAEAKTFLGHIAERTGAGFEKAYETWRRCPALVTCLTQEQAESSALDLKINGFDYTPNTIRETARGLTRLFIELGVAA